MALYATTTAQPPFLVVGLKMHVYCNKTGFLLRVWYWFGMATRYIYCGYYPFVTPPYHTLWSKYEECRLYLMLHWPHNFPYVFIDYLKTQYIIEFTYKD